MKLTKLMIAPLLCSTFMLGGCNKINYKVNFEEFVKAVSNEGVEYEQCHFDLKSYDSSHVLFEQFNDVETSPDVYHYKNTYDDSYSENIIHKINEEEYEGFYRNSVDSSFTRMEEVGKDDFVTPQESFFCLKSFVFDEFLKDLTLEQIYNNLKYSNNSYEGVFSVKQDGDSLDFNAVLRFENTNLTYFHAYDKNREVIEAEIDYTYKQIIPDVPVVPESTF